jgi:hypothetical protein
MFTKVAVCMISFNTDQANLILRYISLSMLIIEEDENSTFNLIIFWFQRYSLICIRMNYRIGENSLLLSLFIKWETKLRAIFSKESLFSSSYKVVRYP